MLCATVEGDEYYYNEVTEESQWEKPESYLRNPHKAMNQDSIYNDTNMTFDNSSQYCDHHETDMSEAAIEHSNSQLQSNVDVTPMRINHFNNDTDIGHHNFKRISSTTKIDNNKLDSSHQTFSSGMIESEMNMKTVNIEQTRYGDMKSRQGTELSSGSNKVANSKLVTESKTYRGIRNNNTNSVNEAVYDQRNTQQPTTPIRSREGSRSRSGSPRNKILTPTVTSSPIKNTGNQITSKTRSPRPLSASIRSQSTIQSSTFLPPPLPQPDTPHVDITRLPSMNHKNFEEQKSNSNSENAVEGIIGRTTHHSHQPQLQSKQQQQNHNLPSAGSNDNGIGQTPSKTPIAIPSHISPISATQASSVTKITSHTNNNAINTEDPAVGIGVNKLLALPIMMSDEDTSSDGAVTNR